MLRRQGVYPGDHILLWFEAQDIGLPAVAGMKVGLPKNPFKLSALYARQRCIESTSLQYFDRFEHPLTRTMCDLYEAKKQAPLWCYAWGGLGLPGTRAFVATTAEGRLKHAVREALAARGYDRDGRRLPATANGRAGPAADLFGTLALRTVDAKAVCNAKFADVLRDVNTIVGVAETHLRRDLDGWRPMSSSRPPQNAGRGGYGVSRNTRQQEHGGQSSQQQQPRQSLFRKVDYSSNNTGRKQEGRG